MSEKKEPKCHRVTTGKGDQMFLCNGCDGTVFFIDRVKSKPKKKKSNVAEGSPSDDL